MMTSFQRFYQESVHRKGLDSLTIFDIDDTLFHTTAKVGVLDVEGKPKAISNAEFNTYKWQPGETPDFSEFRDARKFNQASTTHQGIIQKVL